MADDEIDYEDTFDEDLSIEKEESVIDEKVDSKIDEKVDDEKSDGKNDESKNNSNNVKNSDKIKELESIISVLKSTETDLKSEIKELKSSNNQKGDKINELNDLLSKAKEKIQNTASNTSTNDNNDFIPPSTPINNSSSSGDSSEALRERITAFAMKNKFESIKLKDGEILKEGDCMMVLGEASNTIKKQKSEIKKKSDENERDRKLVNGDSGNLINRIKDLEEELKLALGAAEDIRLLKAKMNQLIDRIRTDKEIRQKLESDSKLNKKKIQMLSDHLEKLMTHLKHEAAAKIRTMEQLRISEKETLRMKEKASLIQRKSTAKDRYLIELREGSNIIEDQLRLMDEKYLELRSKLDWARENGARRVKKAEKIAADLRVKYALAGGTGNLDNVPLPDIYGGSTTTDGEGDSTYNAGLSLVSTSVSSKSTKKKSKKQSKNQNNSMTEKQPDIDQVMEKIRLKSGGPPEWTDDRLKALVASR